MKTGHGFEKEHGFTGSAMPTKEFRPDVPGFKRGGNVHVKQVKEVNVPMNPGSNDDEMSTPIMPQPANMKHGGIAHIKGHHKNYSHGGRIEHDSHPKHDHMKHDKDGYQMHKGHGHKKMHHEE